MWRKLSPLATCSIFEPGSVMARKWLLASSAPTAFFISSKKYCLRTLGSSVEPDLLATTTSVSARLTLSRAAFTCTGSVESTMCSSGKQACRPKVTLSTSGHRLEPPMPTSSTDFHPGDEELSPGTPDLKPPGWKSVLLV